MGGRARFPTEAGGQKTEADMENQQFAFLSPEKKKKRKKAFNLMFFNIRDSCVLYILIKKLT